MQYATLSASSNDENREPLPSELDDTADEPELDDTADSEPLALLLVSSRERRYVRPCAKLPCIRQSRMISTPLRCSHLRPISPKSAAYAEIELDDC